MSWVDGIARCDTCEERHEDVEVAMVPDSWAALFEPGRGWLLFCGGCATAGIPELYRAARILPRTQRWAYPKGIMSIYRPLAREVLLATPEGMASLQEADAVRLRDALDSALAMRPMAEGVVA